MVSLHGEPLRWRGSEEVREFQALEEFIPDIGKKDPRIGAERHRFLDHHSFQRRLVPRFGKILTAKTRLEAKRKDNFLKKNNEQSEWFTRQGASNHWNRQITS